MKPSKEFFFGIFRRLFYRPKEKVFVIGFHKTGTSSMGKALQRIGYRVCGSLKEGGNYSESNLTLREFLMEKSKCLFEKYDAFQDTPWFLLYEELYEKFPKAKFILTIREPENWIASVNKHFGKGQFLYHNQIYPSCDSVNNKEDYKNIYKSHNEEVIRFFKEKDKEILVMDLTHDNSWKSLSEYLGVKRPKSSFPHTNKAGSSKLLHVKFKRLIKKWLYG